MFDEIYKKYNEQICPDEELVNKMLKNAREEQESKKSKRSAVIKRAAILLLTCFVTGGSVFAAGVLIKQKHIKIVSEEEEMELLKKEAEEKKQDTISQKVDVTAEIDEKDLKEVKPWIEHYLPANEKRILEEGTKDTLWTRKLTDMEEENSYDVVYEYPNLSAAFSDQNIAFDVSMIEQQYPNLAGENGAVFTYDTKELKHCIKYFIVSGYMDEKGNYVGIYYSEDYERENEENTLLEPKDLYDGLRYYHTSDGVEVLITNSSEKRYDAEVYSTYGVFSVTFYGDFSDNKMEKILDSLQIAKGMKINEE